MIRLSGVSYTYPDAASPALHEIHLTVRRGEWVLLTGHSGCGKSTLLHLINGVIPHLVGGNLTGSVDVAGREPCQVPIREISRQVGTVFQNPEVQLFMLRGEDDVAFGCENLGFPPEETRRRTDDALARLALTDVRRQEVHTLSGGQKQRLAIAGALAAGTTILLLDEPTSDLDEVSRAALLETLRDLHARGHTLVMTEHRLDGLRAMVDRVLRMDEGRLVDRGCFPDVPPLAPRRSPEQQDRGVLVECEGLRFAYPGREPVLCDVSLRVRAGEVVALTGPNGSGKTTLLKLLCGLLRPAKGTLCVDGVVQPTMARLVGRVGLLFQNPDEQLFNERVADEIAFGPRNIHREADVAAYLDRTGLARYAEAHPRSLSRGERQRLAAAAVLAMQPKVLLLDEPTTGLDQPGWVSLLDLIVEEAARYGACVIFSTHHREAARAFAGRTLQVAQGRLVDDRLP